MLRAGTGEIEAGREDFVEGREKRNAGQTSKYLSMLHVILLQTNREIQSVGTYLDAVRFI